MAESFNCPNCNASLELQSADGEGHIYVGDSEGVKVFDSQNLYLHTIEGSRSVFSIDVDNEDNLLRLRP